MTPRQPASAPLSVVVVTVEGAARLRTCLTALTRQSEATEIIVPWDSTHGNPGRLQAEFPTVQFLPLGPRRLTYAQLRAKGVERAAGEIIATTEDHFVPAPEWCRRILEAHRAPHAAIGGAVEKQTPDTTLSWAFYLADYLRYLDPPEGPSHSLTDGNVSYKRPALAAIRNVWGTEFHEDLVHAALAGIGESIWLSPKIVARQSRTLTLRQAVRDRYAFGRLFGSTRVQGRGALQRAGLALLCPLVPGLLLARIAAHLRRTRRYTLAGLRAFPALVLISTVWAWGEFVGTVTTRPEESLTARPHAATGFPQ